MIRNIVEVLNWRGVMYNYKNPFAEFNSNTLSSQQIADLFAEPFDLFNISLSDIISEKSSIIFEGGRGTGKTMLLRQFSYNVQKVYTNKISFLEKIRNDKYIGIYFRVDNPLLRSFDLFANYSTDIKIVEKMFTHYFELTIFKEYIELVKLFMNDANIKIGDMKYKNMVIELSRLISEDQTIHKDDIDELLKFVIEQINYIWDYQSKKAIDIDDNLVFKPSCGMILYGRLTNEFCKCSCLKDLGIDDVCIMLLIDEFENFSEDLQKVLNTAMRFTKDYGARLRIGMRPNGFKTYDTLTVDDFVKEGRDYRKVEFGNPLINKSNNSLYPELLKKIAGKRLSLVPMLSGKNIVDFLGEDEDLEKEAKDIVRGQTKHLETYLQEINKVRIVFNKSAINIDSLSRLRDENPLYEMENLRLLLKGEDIEYVIKAFEDYKNNVDSPEREKFSNDYDKKYKLSFVFVLSSIYRKEKKKYYGFVDFCQLSSGIIGCFLGLCRHTFDLAYFKDNDALFSGKIDPNIQTDAACEYAYSERDMIQRIAKYGSKLQVFINNIGNAFSHVHKDIYIRYPETNSFPISKLNEENKKLIDLACTWSLIIKKPNAQDTKGNNNKQNIYILNRIFAPVFKISYRTRGGLNPITVNDDFFKTDFDPRCVLSKTNKRVEHMKGQQSDKMQISLFNDLDEINDNKNSVSEDIN